MGKKLQDNHFSLTTCNEVYEICRPLFESFGFTHFHFRRTFNDRSRAVLCTNPDWVKYFYHTKKYDVYGIYEDLKPNGDITIHAPLFNHFNQMSTPQNPTANSVSNASAITSKVEPVNFVLWPTLFELPVFNHVFEDAREFKIDHGITITETHEDFCTFFQIGTIPERAHLMNFYLNNFNILNIFITYFKDKGAHLIKMAEANRITSDDSLIQHPSLELNKIPTINQEMVDKFYFQINFTQHNPETSYKAYGLSRREIESIHYLLQGYTAKQIANTLNLSYRTIEFYIANVKAKLNCYTKPQLIKKLHEIANTPR